MSHPNIGAKVNKKWRKRNRSGKSATSRMRVYYNNLRIEFVTGIRVDADKWDKANQRATGMNQAMQTASEINDYLDYLKAVIIKVFHKYEFMEEMPIREQLKTDFNERISQKDDENGSYADYDKQVTTVKKNVFWDAFREFIKVNGRQNDWTEATYEKFHAMENHLKEFRKVLTFDFFDDDGLLAYVEYLRLKKNMKNSTIGKQMSFLKWFLRWSYQRGYNDNRDFETFKPKLKSTQKKVIFLTRDEITKLVECKIPADESHLDRVRDVFLFCCYTGLRDSDVYNLRKSDVKDDHIEITTIKTTDSLTIELNKYSKAILEKCKNADFEEFKVLPVVSNQKMNTYLHELCKLAKIDEPIRQTFYKGNERIDIVKPKYELIGTHAGRRTFICSALALGIPAQVVMKWTGHSDYKAMKPYIDIADDIKAKAMQKFNSF
ncbi:phage integrase SAM-like domain-containing protein [Prevotella sp. E9-3]|uniref:site-specific integrase n=1 Tax=Prevotella sp. E9-3 TaxID=2913621 RepID=UPI00351D5A06